jgi:hypothetical protein
LAANNLLRIHKLVAHPLPGRLPGLTCFVQVAIQKAGAHIAFKMVFHSSSSTARGRAAGSTSQQDSHQHQSGVHQSGVNQAPLKRKRSLSKFYFAKSQSFNCMSDLLKSSVFSKSSLLLAKRSSSSSSSGAGSFPSISEDMSECTSPRGPFPEASAAAAAAALGVALHPSPFAGVRCNSLQRRSWDARDCSSPEPFCSVGCLNLPALLDHNSCQDVPQQQQQHLDVISSLTSRSGSISLELAASDDEAGCWPADEADRGTTESLCMALQTTSLAAAAAAPQSLMPVGGGGYLGCYMVEV